MSAPEPIPAETAAPAGEFAHLDPNAVEVHANVRTEAAVTAEFVASIAAHGVLQPVSAVRRPDGTVAIRHGQRRTFPGK